MKNKFTITEGESQRILGLHKRAILKDTDVDSYGTKYNHRSSFAEQITGSNKRGVIVEEVNCKNKNPYNAFTDAGLNWKEESRKWIEAKCNGTTPCILGNAQTNINLRNAFCDKTWSTDQNNSNKYTFDFEAVMKAIDDTGKCSNIISDVSEVYKQTKQEKFLLRSENGTLVDSNVSTPEGTEWKADDKKKGAGTRIGTNIIIFICEGAFVENVNYNFYDKEKNTVLSNEEFGSILKNQFCNGKIKQDPIKDDVKSGLNNVVNPINTTISKDKYYEYISN